jgi:hypothetical protein
MESKTCIYGLWNLSTNKVNVYTNGTEDQASRNNAWLKGINANYEWKAEAGSTIIPSTKSKSSNIDLIEIDVDLGEW